MDRITSMTAFVQVVDHGSFSAAARLTGSTQPTIGRQIQTLETTLGLKLFTRSQRGLAPTAAARELISHAESMASAASALHRASSGGAGEQAGTVRLTAGEHVGLEVLPPILAAFAREPAPVDAATARWARQCGAKIGNLPSKPAA